MYYTFLLKKETKMPVNSFEYYPLTWRPDRNNLTRPVYLSLAQLLENDILNGVLRRDTKLPPQRELADFLDINFTTVTRAYTIRGLFTA